MQTHINFTGLTDLFSKAVKENRNFLYEYEVYDFIRLFGAKTVPQYLVVPKDARLDPDALNSLPGEQVVIKVVSPHIVHKSDVGGVCIISKTQKDVLSAIRRMSHEIPDKLVAIIEQRREQAPLLYRNLKGTNLRDAIFENIHGVVLCQYMQPDSEKFGNELLISLRNSREFGMIISAGLGGTDTELYAERFKKGQAIVSASTEQVDGEVFFNMFKRTISYKKLAGRTRGQQRRVTDGQLLECFTALIQVANYFSQANPISPFVIEELEVNPFGFSNYLMMPLDGLCNFSTCKKPLYSRPVLQIDHLLHPKSIGIAGISAKSTNMGKIILENILKNNYPSSRIFPIHPAAKLIEAIPVVKGLKILPEKLDLLILAVNASLVPAMIDEILENDLAESVLLVSGGLGEQEGQEHLISDIKEQIISARQTKTSNTIFLGANSLGILSQPGHFDAMFIPDSKLPKTRGSYERTSALVSQSGAYMITRMSKLSFLDPAYAISVGNQIDLTAGDFLKYFNTIESLKTIGFYVEGFTDLDGLEFTQAIRDGVPLGKEIIFYKAGRTPEGKNALSGHTASIAGDYMVCESCISEAGAMVAETFNVFEGLLRLSCTLHNKTISGYRLAAISNAGYEAVGIADNILGDDYRLEMARFSLESTVLLEKILTGASLNSLTSVNNPLDITPMASEDVYVQAINVLLRDENVDAIIVAIVPLTPILHTLPEEFENDDLSLMNFSLIEQIAGLNGTSSKPLVIVVDSGSLYDSLADGFQNNGLPVFRSADIAVTVLRKYMQSRLKTISQRRR